MLVQKQQPQTQNTYLSGFKLCPRDATNKLGISGHRL